MFNTNLNILNKFSMSACYNFIFFKQDIYLWLKKDKRHGILGYITSIYFLFYYIF